MWSGANWEFVLLPVIVAPSVWPQFEQFSLSRSPHEVLEHVHVQCITCKYLVTCTRTVNCTSAQSGGISCTDTAAFCPTDRKELANLRDSRVTLLSSQGRTMNSNAGSPTWYGAFCKKYKMLMTVYSEPLGH